MIELENLFPNRQPSLKDVNFEEVNFVKYIISPAGISMEPNRIATFCRMANPKIGP